MRGNANVTVLGINSPNSVHFREGGSFAYRCAPNSAGPDRGIRQRFDPEGAADPVADPSVIDALYRYFAADRPGLRRRLMYPAHTALTIPADNGADVLFQQHRERTLLERWVLPNRAVPWSVACCPPNIHKSGPTIRC